MAELKIIKQKFTLSYDNVLIVTVQQYVNHYNCKFFNKVTHQRFVSRFIRSYFPDIYKLIPALKTYIEDNFCSINS